MFSRYSIQFSFSDLKVLFYIAFESCINFRLAARDESEQNRSVPALVEISWWQSVLHESALVASLGGNQLEVFRLAGICSHG